MVVGVEESLQLAGASSFEYTQRIEISTKQFIVLKSTISNSLHCQYLNIGMLSENIFVIDTSIRTLI